MLTATFALALLAHPDGCDVRFETPVDLSPNQEDEKLVVTFEGHNCGMANALWRLYGNHDTVLWADVSTHDMLTPPDAPPARIRTADEVRAYYTAKVSEFPNPLPRTSELPAWSELDGEYQDFIWQGEVNASPAEGINEYRWEYAREQDRPVLCLVPGSHYADCYWLTPDSQFVMLFNPAW